MEFTKISEVNEKNWQKRMKNLRCVGGESQKSVLESASLRGRLKTYSQISSNRIEKR